LQTDRPFLSTATGYTAANPTGQYVLDRGIDDTFLRSYTPSGGTTGRLLEDPNVLTGASQAPHPYLQYQLMSKIFNNVTNRSNVFAVWVTVGFFEVTDTTTTPPKLGLEIGKAEGRNIRHRMFAIVDRTQMASFVLQTPAITPTQDPTSNVYTPQAFAPTAYTDPVSGATWSVGAGGAVTDSRTGASASFYNTVVTVLDPNGANEETVAVDGTGKATFTKSHAANSLVICRGNPGPWKRYDPKKDPVVLYFNIIE